LRNSQRFSSQSKDESAGDGQPVVLIVQSQSKEDLTHGNNGGKDAGSQADSKDAIHKKSSAESNDSVGPGIDGIQPAVFELRNVGFEVILDLWVHGPRHIIHIV